MTEKKLSYLEQELDVTISRSPEEVIFTFQRTKVKLKNELEIDFIKAIDPIFKKEVHLTEDEINIHIHPPKEFLELPKIRKKSEMKQRTLAHQLIKKVMDHSLERLHLVICPENICFDPSLTPYFYYYGVEESIPPYEVDEDHVLEQLKATVCYIVDGQYKFSQYLKFSETLKLSDFAKSIMNTTSMEELDKLIKDSIFQLEKIERNHITLPKNKWKIQRYTMIGLIVILIPAILYSFYALFFQIPRQEAYVKSNDYFLRQQYSQVISTLDKYNPESMPYIVQYQLASSYVIHEPLTEEQRRNVQATITLQTDPNYLLYWIYIGRGMNEEAIDIARSMEDQELVVYGLIKYREEIRSDDKLSGAEKQEKIEPLQREIDEYEEEQKRLKEEAERAEEEAAKEARQKEQEEAQQQQTEEENQAVDEANESESEDTDANSEEENEVETNSESEGNEAESDSESSEENETQN